MKNFKLFLAACLLGFATAANAQFANSSATSVSEDNDAWQGIRVSYNSFTIETDEEDSDDFDKVNSFEVGYVKAFPISSTTPLFLETGASLMWTKGDLYEEYGMKTSMDMKSINIPLNLVYKFPIKDGVSLAPYAGVYVRYNLSGEIELSEYGSKVTIDMFDEDEGDGENLQYGMQIGGVLNIKRFNIGVGYGFDFNEIMEETKTNKLTFTIGLNF